MKWNISDKVRLIFGAIVFSLFCIGLFVYINIKRLETNTDWVDHSHRIIHSLQKIYADLKDTQTNYADFLLTKNQNFSKSCESGLDNLDLEIQDTDALVGDDMLWRQNMDDLKTSIGKRMTYMREGLAYVRAGRPDLAIGKIQSESEKKSNKAIKELIARMSGMQIWMLKTRNDFELSNTRKNIRFMVFGTLSVILACGLAFYFIVRQINERHAALSRLKTNEERFRFLAENASEAFVTSDARGDIVDINPAAEIMFGYSKTELIGQNLTRLMPEEFLKTHGEKSFSQFLAMTNPKSGVSAVELMARKNDSTEFPVEVSLSSWETKDGVFHTTITRDITERKFFMKTLLKNEHRLFQFLEAIPVGILVRDKFGIPYYSNQAAKNILGRDVMKDSDMAKISEVYQAYRAGTNELYPSHKFPIVRAVNGDKSFIDDMEIRHPGKIVPVQVWGAPIFDENGEVKYALAAMIDATHQKEITESLQSREEFFRNLFEEGPIGMTLSFPDSTYVNVNRAFANILGLPKDQIIGKSFLEFTHPDDLPSEQLLSQKLFDKLIPKYELEKRYITQKGQTIWCKLSASSIRDINDEPLFRLAVVENITDQKEAELAIKESEEKFRRVFSESPLGMSFIGRDGIIEDTNKAFSDMLGYSHEELVQTNVYDITHPDDIEISRTLSQARAGGQRTKNVEKRYITKDGKTIWTNVTPLLMKEKDGNSYRVLSIVEDISERKQIEDMKNDLVSVVSHQLKTPVAEINGYIENMLEGLAGALSPKQERYLLDMKSIGMENYRLISDLLSMSKIERGVITVDPQPVPLGQFIELAFRDYETLIQKKGLELIIDNDPEGVWVLADSDKTVETLRNIINNAIKCTDRGSITIRLKTDGAFGVIEVVDTGIGMSEETLKRLFTKDRALGAEAGRSGAGLGLYIAKNFMNLQNGDITVTSIKDKGTCFSVKIPLSSKERAAHV